jgi:hypothetical protein
VPDLPNRVKVPDQDVIAFDNGSLSFVFLGKHMADEGRYDAVLGTLVVVVELAQVLEHVFCHFIEFVFLEKMAEIEAD